MALPATQRTHQSGELTTARCNETRVELSIYKYIDERIAPADMQALNDRVTCWIIWQCNSLDVRSFGSQPYLVSLFATQPGDSFPFAAADALRITSQPRLVTGFRAWRPLGTSTTLSRLEWLLEDPYQVINKGSHMAQYY